MVTASVPTKRLPSLAPPCGPNNTTPIRLVLVGPLWGGCTAALHTWALLSLSLTPSIINPLHLQRCSAICLSQANLFFNFCHWELGFSHGEPSRDRHAHCSCRAYRAYCTPGSREKIMTEKFLLFRRLCSRDLSVTERLHAGSSAFVTKPSNRPCLGGLQGTDRAHSRTCHASVPHRAGVDPKSMMIIPCLRPEHIRILNLLLVEGSLPSVKLTAPPSTLSVSDIGMGLSWTCILGNNCLRT